VPLNGGQPSPSIVNAPLALSGAEGLGTKLAVKAPKDSGPGGSGDVGC